MMIMVSSNCSCSRLASHSRCASDESASDESRMLLEMDGSESTSSSSWSGDSARSATTNDSVELVMADDDMLAEPDYGR